jgi:hypothetical protein
MTDKQNIDNLIANLSKDSKAKPTMPSPNLLGFAIAAVLFTYAAVAQCVLGIRPDLLTQLERGFFLAEIILLLIIIFSSVISAVLISYPDSYQSKYSIKTPFVAFIALIFLFFAQVFLPLNPLMALPTGPDVHEFECVICISAVTIIPAIILFLMQRKGATTNPLSAGAFSILASAAIGCLTLRIAEQNDSLSHLITMHYIPVVVFAFLGSVLGRFFLRW